MRGGGKEIREKPTLASSPTAKSTSNAKQEYDHDSNKALITSYPASTRACSPRARQGPSPARSHRSSHTLAAEPEFAPPLPLSPLLLLVSQTMTTTMVMLARHPRCARRPCHPTHVGPYPHPRLARAESCSGRQPTPKREVKKVRSQRRLARTRCRGAARASARPSTRAPLGLVSETTPTTPKWTWSRAWVWRVAWGIWVRRKMGRRDVCR